jgi:hypothetical protein
MRIRFDQIPANAPITNRIYPIPHPTITNIYGSDSTPPPIAAEHKANVLPLTPPFSSLLNERSKNVLLFIAPGLINIAVGLMLISPVAFE